MQFQVSVSRKGRVDYKVPKNQNNILKKVISGQKCDSGFKSLKMSKKILPAVND